MLTSPRQLSAVVATVLALSLLSTGVEAQRIEEVSVGLVADSRFTAFALSPSEPGVAYIAAADGWVYVTEDGGASWSPRGLAAGRTVFYGSARIHDRPSLSRINGGTSTLEPNASTVFNFSNSQTEQLYFDGLPTALAQLRGDRVIRLAFDSGLGATRPAMRLDQPRNYHHLRLSQGRFGALNPGFHAEIIALDRTSASVQWLAVHPTDPRECYAATADGLYRTTDGGASWLRIYWASQAARRDVVHVAYSPHDSSRVLAATRAGVQLSAGGTEFAPVADARFATSATRHILFDPRDPDQEIFITGRVYGRSVSRDVAIHLDWRSIVISDAREALFDPADAETVLIRADAGIWVSHDGGSSFERAGGATFIGVNVTSIAVSPRGRHFLASTARDLWESRDGGDSWQSVTFGAYDEHLVRVAFDPHEDGVVWVVGRRRVIRLEPAASEALNPTAGRLYTQWSAAQPRLEDAIHEATRRLRLRREDLNRYARRAAWSSWLPTVRAGFRARDVGAEATIDARFAGIAGDFFEDVFDNRYSHPDTAFVVTASWGDSDRSFAPVVRERMVQEWSQELHRDERRLTDRVGRYYSERARLMAQEFADSVRDARTVQMRAHRIHELTSHLAHLTGGLIQPPP